MNKPLLKCIDAFENETEHIEIGGMHIENGLKLITIYGLLDIPRTSYGLDKILSLKRHIDAIAQKLKDENLPSAYLE